MMRWKLGVAVFLMLSAAQAAAHGPGGHGAAGEEIRDHVVARQGDRLLSLRMVPQEVLKKVSGQAAVEYDAQGDAVYRARVGELAFLVAELTDGGDPVTGIDYALKVEHVEAGQPMFSTRAQAPEGTMSWGQQFFDGAPHRVSITATSTDGSFAPITAQMVVGVQAVPPPSHIVARTLMLLLGITGIFMILGYGGRLYCDARLAPGSPKAVEVVG